MVKEVEDGDMVWTQEIELSQNEAEILTKNIEEETKESKAPRMQL